jgi:hypothetical protein
LIVVHEYSPQAMQQILRIDDLFDRATGNALESRRILYSRWTYMNFGGVVRYGALKGFTLGDEPFREPGDIAPKLFGLYEREVLDSIAAVRGKHRILVNIGADDGYYGVGLVKAGFFERSVCFEATERGRGALKATAQKNGVSDRIRIFGAASSDFPSVFAGLGFDARDCFVVCDVEGAEFAIFSSECLDTLKGSHIIIELHGFMMPNGNLLEQSLLLNSQKNFTASFVKTGARDLSLIPELETVNDSDRWLICSEGRMRLMSWLILAPK